ncbi:MAG: hypothetical protein HKN50_08450 [Gammaproteobacteria bacterium]|nr:hypothetical protein [Gammaproteobacteria bacterium]
MNHPMRPFSLTSLLKQVPVPVKRLSLLGLLALCVADANAQSANPLIEIERDIQQGQQSTARAKLRLNQLLSVELPGAQDSLDQSRQQSNALREQLIALQSNAIESEAALQKVSNQLQRANTLLQAKLQELSAAQAETAHLQGLVSQQSQGANSPATQMKRHQQELAALNQQLAMADQQLKVELQRQQALQQEEMRRREMSAQLIEGEDAHKQSMRAQQAKLRKLEGDIKSTNRSNASLDRKLKSEQSTWDKTEAALAKRKAQQETLLASIASGEQRLAELAALRASNDQTLSEAKAVTGDKKARLSELKSEVAQLKKRNRATERDVSTAEKALANSKSQQQRELNAQVKLDSQIEASINTVATLQRNELDMRAEIEQIEQLTTAKLAEIEPLRKEVEALRAKRDAQLEAQSQLQSRVTAINEELIVADARYQSISQEKQQLEAELQSLRN